MITPPPPIETGHYQRDVGDSGTAVVARDVMWLGVASGIRTCEDALGSTRLIGSFHGPRLLELCTSAGC
jgi:hypothetical protein